MARSPLRRWTPLFLLLLLVAGLGYLAVEWLPGSFSASSGTAPERQASALAREAATGVTGHARARKGIRPRAGAASSASTTIARAGSSPGGAPTDASSGEETGASAGVSTVSLPARGVPAPTVSPDVLAKTGLSGRVVDDRGAPVAEARVRIQRRFEMRGGRGGASMVMISMAETVIAGGPGSGGPSTKTRPDGRFTILGLDPASRYRVRASKSGFVDARRPAPELKPGEVVDVGVLRLETAGAIEGVVVTADGTPIEGATVWLDRSGPGGVGMFMGSGPRGGATMMAVKVEVESEDGPPASGPPVSSPPKRLRRKGRARTDADGRFRLADVSLGPHRVAAEKNGHRRAERGGVEVAPGAVAEVRLTLGGAFELKLTVRDAEQRPIEGVSVGVGVGAMLLPPGVKHARSSPPQTAADGAVLLSDIKTREVTVSLVKVGYVRLTTKLALEETGLTIHEVVLLAAGRVIGRVIDGAGQPVTLAHARLRTAGIVSGAAGFSRGLQLARVDDGGRFEFSSAGPGVYELHVSAAGQELRRGPLNVKAGETIDVGDLALARTGSIRVSVVDETDGSPVAGALAAVEPRGMLLIIDGGDSDAEARTDAAGVVVLPDVPAGSQRVRVDHPEFGVTTVSVDVAAGAEAAVVVVLAKGGEITGRVARRDGTPAPRVTVMVRGTSSGFTTGAQTDESGRFRVSRLSPGRYELRALSQDGSGTAPGPAVETEVVAGAVAEVLVVLAEEEKREIRGRVLTAAGLSAAGYAVQYGPAAAFALRGADVTVHFSGTGEPSRTDAAGAFVLPVPALRLPPGSGRTMVVSVSAPGGGRWLFPLPDPDPDQVLVLRLAREGSLELTGTVTDGSRGLAGAAVTIERMGVVGEPRVRREVTAGPDGRFRGERLVAGTYRVTASFSGHRTQRTEVAVVEGEAASVELTMRPAGFLAVRVTRAAAGSTWVAVTATAEGETSARRSGETGSVIVFDDRTPGVDYTVTVQGEGGAEVRRVIQAKPTLPPAVELVLP